MLRPGAAAHGVGGRRGAARRLRRRVHGHARQLHRFDNELRFRGDAARVARQRCSTSPRCSAGRALRPGVDAEPQARPRHALGPRRRRPTRSSPAPTPRRRTADRARGVALFVIDRGALLRQALVETSDDPLDNIPPPGFDPVAVTGYYARLCPLLTSSRASWRRRGVGHAVTSPRRGLADRAARRARRAVQLRWALAVARAAGRSFALRVWGAKHGPALRLQRRRERALRPARRSGCSATAGTRTTSSTRRPTRTCCTSSSPSGSAAAPGCRDAFATDPTEVFVVARVTAAVLGTLAVWLLYLAGTRLFADRRVGLLAAGAARRRLPAGLLLAPRAQRRADAGADLPVAVGHGGRRCATGRVRDYAARRARASAWRARRSTPAAIVLLPLLAAAAAQFLRGPAARRRAARAALVVAGARGARRVRRRQPLRAARLRRVPRRPQPPDRRVADDALGKLGLTAGQRRRLLPVDVDVGAGLGAARSRRSAARSLLLRDEPRRSSPCSCPAPVAVPAVHGLAGALLRPLADAGVPDASACWRPTRCFELALSAGAARRPGAAADADRRRGARAAAARGWSTRCTSARCCRAPTRATRRAPGWSPTCRRATKIVVEPVVPDGWAQDIGHPSPLTANGNRWVKYPTSRSQRSPTTARRCPAPGASSTSRTTSGRCTPALIDSYEAQGYCWVRHRLDAARPRGGRARRRARGDRLLPRAASAAATSSTTPRRIAAGAGPVRVQLRLVVRLLPAGLPAARGR